MKKTSYHILRVGIAITFLWIGVLILKDPNSWGGFVEDWVIKLLPIPIDKFMIFIAVQDIAIGAFLLVDMWTWAAAAFAAFHLISVLVVSGINTITIRDIGLFAGSIALLAETLPQQIISKFKRKG